MSHFAVVVIGDNHEEQLAPYHEYECTGENNQFVQNIDETEEYRQMYEKAEKTVVVDENGTFFDRYDDRFYRPATEEQVNLIKENDKNWIDRKHLGFDFRHRKVDGVGVYEVYSLPFGHTKTKTSVKNVMTFREFIKNDCDRVEVMSHISPPNTQDEDQKWGYTEIDENGEVIRTIKRTNPNAKWDWWVVGGRWTGFFKMKEGETGTLGRPGLMTAPGGAGYADQAKKSQIDFAAMRDEAAKKALERHAKVIEAIDDVPFKTWVEIREAHGEGKIDDARAEYHGQQAIKNLREKKLDFFMYDALEFAKKTKEQVEKDARNKAGLPYAIVKDGVWFAKGEMGWFGCSNDTVTDEQWAEEFAKLVDSVPDDTVFTLVDCHI